MDFNLDDPLAGILSDGSDDSFFDDDVLGKKKPAKKKETTPIAQKKNDLFDLGGGEPKPKSTSVSSERKDSLFGLGDADTKKVIQTDEDRKPSVSVKRDIPSPAAPIKTPITPELNTLNSPEFRDKSDAVKPSSKLKTSASFVDKLDVLGEEANTKKKELPKPLEKGKSSHSLLDDILGGSSSKTGGSAIQTRPTTAAKTEFDFDSLLGKSESKQTLLSTKTTIAKQTTKVEKPKEAAKKEAPPKKKSSYDWLGIFNDTNKDENEEEDDTGMPSWLIGGDTKKKKQKEERKTPVPPKAETPEPEKPIAEGNLPQFPNSDFVLLSKGVGSSKSLPAGDEDMSAEALYLQQQESQLMVALQLKAQEEKLAAMQSMFYHIV